MLVVADVERSAAFYRDVVGLVPEKDPSPEWAWFWAGAPGAAQRLALRKGTLLFEEHSPHPPGHRFGQVHFALRVNHPELDAALMRLRDRSIRIHGPVALDWMRADSWYFYDPDGNLVEFWVPRDCPV